jgi:hypothetical protein
MAHLRHAAMSAFAPLSVVFCGRELDDGLLSSHAGPSQSAGRDGELYLIACR